MQTEAAILWEYGADWSVEPIELDPPKEGEVLVKYRRLGHVPLRRAPASPGTCRCRCPMIGGHEGAGVVEEVGPGVTGLKPGDHVVLGFIPACGTCPSCATGHSNLCDLGAILMSGRQIDGTSGTTPAGQDVSRPWSASAPSPAYTVVNQASCVKILDDVPLDKACLVGCGVTTGWGSAVYAADIRPGDNVAVIGIGGIGAVGSPGRTAGRRRDDLRHRPRRAQAHAGAHVRGHPRLRRRSKRRSS